MQPRVPPLPRGAATEGGADGADDAPGRKSILAAVTALEDLSTMIVDASSRIGAPITLKKEDDGG